MFVKPYDIVLFYIKNKPDFFARVEDITPDVKPNWYVFTFLRLSLPLTETSWILEKEQIEGKEFSMGGIPVKIERILNPEELRQMREKEKKKKPKKAEVIKFPGKKA